MTLTLENIHRGITQLMSLDIKWGIPHLLGVSGFAQRGAFAQESFCAYNLMLHEQVVNRPPRPAQTLPLEHLRKLGRDARVRVEHTRVGNLSPGRADLGRKSNPRSSSTQAWAE